MTAHKSTEIIHDTERDLWDVWIADVLFCSCRMREQAEIALEMVIEPRMRRTPIAQAESLLMQEAIDNLRMRLIRDAMEKTNGNKKEAAKLLGIGRTTLCEMKKKLEAQAIALIG